MKAKELAEKLMENPDMEVVMFYRECDHIFEGKIQSIEVWNNKVELFERSVCDSGFLKDWEANKQFII